MTVNPAIVMRPGEGVTLEGPAGGPLTFKVRGAETADALTAFENIVAPGDGPPLHRHANEDESWYVIDGTLRFRLGEEIAEAPTGSFVFVPRGLPHCFENSGNEPARILVMFTPSGMERFFEAFAGEAAADGKPDPDAFVRAGEPVGMEVLGPPLRISHPL